MMANIKKAGTSASTLEPEPKYVLFSEGKIRMYQPKPDQVTVYDLGKDRADLESYVVLGFGGSGQDLQKAFDVKFQATETVNGVSAAKLELTPKSEEVRAQISKVQMWIDESSWLPVQQKFFEAGSADYLIFRYSDVKKNLKIDESRFKADWPKNATKIKPRG